MRIEKNMDVQTMNSQNPGSTTATEKNNKNKKNKKDGPITIAGADLLGGSLIQQRQNFAKKQALKVVSDAFAGEKKLDAQMQSIKDEIKRLQDEIDEKKAERKEIQDKLKELQLEYGIDPDSEESKELSGLARLLNNPNVDISDEDRERLSEYQQKALAYVALDQQYFNEIETAKLKQMGNVQGYADMKSERAKSQDMLKAQDAAEEIMEASNGETVALLTREAVEHVDEEEKEREEEEKKAAKKKKEEQKKEADKLEKEAMRQEMIENIKEQVSVEQRTSADVKRAIARRERAEADRMDSEGMQKVIISDATSLEDTQDAVNSEITNILNRLALLSSDVKGSTIDNQV